MTADWHVQAMKLEAMAEASQGAERVRTHLRLAEIYALNEADDDAIAHFEAALLLDADEGLDTVAANDLRGAAAAHADWMWNRDDWGEAHEEYLGHLLEKRQLLAHVQGDFMPMTAFYIAQCHQRLGDDD
jgi:hypothetical protein